MDRRLNKVITCGDVSVLTKLIEQDENILRQTDPRSLNTVLHLSARFGHLELAKEIIKRCPDMVVSENAELETPLYEACREGHLEIVKLLLENDAAAAVYDVNSRDESVFFAACEREQIHVVKYLSSFPRLLMLEVDMATSSLHAVASSDGIEIVKEILKARPDFARKKDSQGCTPLHIACSNGQLEITRELTKLNSGLCLIQDYEGRLPLHHAAIRGRINIVAEVISICRESAEVTTSNGETILHLAVKNNQYEVVKYLTENIDVSKLLNMKDNDGNTILHLAAAGKLTTMVTYLLKIRTEVNSVNRKGCTALDVIEADARNSGALAIVAVLLQAGGKRCDQLSPGLIDVQPVLKSSPKLSLSCPNRTCQDCLPERCRHQQQNHRGANILDVRDQNVRSAQETITIVAVLIATVTFAAGINPPGGFSQETGKAIRADRAAFKVFLLCNITALFLSIGVVIILGSLIPTTIKAMRSMLCVTNNVTWISAVFMVAAYIAAIWTTMPNEKGGHWVLLVLVAFAGGCTIAVFLAWGSVVVFRLLRRARQKNMKDRSPGSSVSGVEELKTIRDQDVSSNSKVESS